MPLDDPMTRAASTRPNSYDPATRTVSAVIATANPVQRRDARGPFNEILTAGTLDFSAVEGLAVLDSHRTASVRDTLGRVRSIALEGDTVVAVLELTAAEDAAPVLQRIADGTVSGVSIGYRVAGWTETNTPQGRVKSPTGWRITEVTLTSNPADPAARLRHQEESPMPDPVIETRPAEEAETQRRSDIRGLVRSAGLAPDVADQLIDQNADMTAAKAAVFDALADQRRSAPVIRTHTAQNDDPGVTMQRQADALHVRMAGLGEPKPEVRQYMGESLLDMARGSLARAGVSTRGMSPDETFTRAAEHTTSDFPNLVSNAMNKTALASYQAAASPLKTLGRQRSLSNFKTATAIRLGEMGRLEELSESGEITATSRAENGESMKLTTYARGLAVSRQLLINDDLSLLGDMTAAFGEAAAQTEADILVELITGNPNLSDGTPVFDASRGNLAGVGAAPSEATLSATRKAMRATKGLDGKTLVNVSPKYLLVGPELETDAEKLLAAIYAATTDDVNVFGSKLSLLVEPRITDASWFVFADPSRLAAIQYGYLSSAQGVQIQRSEAWNTLGLKFRAWLDFGAGWLESRAAYLNEGA